MTITNAELIQIKERVSNATDEGWDVWEKDGVIMVDGIIGSLIEVLSETDEQATYTYVERADAEFIAHARQDVPKLVSEVERLQNALLSISAICDSSELVRQCTELSLIDDIVFEVLLEVD